MIVQALSFYVFSFLVVGSAVMVIAPEVASPMRSRPAGFYRPMPRRDVPARPRAAASWCVSSRLMGALSTAAGEQSRRSGSLLRRFRACCSRRFPPDAESILDA